MSDPHYGTMPPTQPPWPSPRDPAPSQAAKWPAYLSLIVAVAAIAVAIGAWFRPLHIEPRTPAPATFTAEQTQNAKARMCAAWDKFHRALTAVTGKNNGSDPNATLAIAVNVRLALHAGSQYLISELDANPATPPPLAQSIRDLANAYYEVAIDQLGEAPDAELQPLGRQAEQATDALIQACQ